LKKRGKGYIIIYVAFFVVKIAVGLNFYTNIQIDKTGL